MTRDVDLIAARVRNAWRLVAAVYNAWPSQRIQEEVSLGIELAARREE